MAAEFPVLDNVRVASPCSAAWDEMQGDERVRFCGHCRKHVYNLSELPRAQAEALVSAAQGELCVRFYRRRDGTLLTQDCPVGRSRLRRALLLQVGLLASVFLAIPGLAGALEKAGWAEWSLWEDERYQDLAVQLRLRKPQPKPVMMGAVASPVLGRTAR